MADVASNLNDWSTTASSNSPTDATTIGAGLADNFQQIQATVRQHLATKGSDIASATTTDLGGTAGLYHDITGTTTITGLGSTNAGAGIWKIVQFDGALTLTNSASLVLPGGANITTAAGDVALFISEGSGTWRCVSYAGSNVYGAKGTFSGVLTAATGSTIGNLTLANGSITDSGGSINFGNENLSTTGTLAAGVTTITGALKSNANDGGALGASGTGWSDLFLAAGGVINWNAGAATITEASGQFQFGGANGTQFVIEDTASAVNYPQVSGASTGNAPYIYFTGTDANVTGFYYTKGSGSHQFKTATDTSPVLQFDIAHTASAVNYLQATGGVTGSPGVTYLSAQGSDSNVSMYLQTKGTGALGITSGASINIAYFYPGATNANYFQFFASASGSSPTIQFTGTDTDVSGVYRTQAAGSHYFYTNSGAQLQFQIGHTASAVNYLQVTGSAGTSPVLSSAGTATNVNIDLQPKGAGAVQCINNSSSSQTALIQNQNASTPYGLLIDFSAASPDNNTQWLIQCDDSTAVRAICYSDGDWANHDGTYGTISDPKVKTFMEPANSQWDDVKALSASMIKYETKFSPGKRMLGVDADVVKRIAPGLVHDADWGDEGTVKIVDTMTMMQKGFKALGEALERIEALESKLN